MLKRAVTGRTLCLLGGLAISMVAAPSASADVKWPVGSEGFTRAQAVAVAFWGEDPCGGRITFEWAPIEQTALGAAVGTSDQSFCYVAFNPWPKLRGTLAPEKWSWPMFCTTMVHELGHLLHGPEHDESDPVMHEAYRGPIRECRSARCR